MTDLAARVAEALQDLHAIRISAPIVIDPVSRALADCWAEVRRLQAVCDDLAAWQLRVADAMGLVNRAEGQGGHEVASPACVIEMWEQMRHESQRTVEAEATLDCDLGCGCGKAHCRVPGGTECMVHQRDAARAEVERLKARAIDHDREWKRQVDDLRIGAAAVIAAQLVEQAAQDRAEAMEARATQAEADAQRLRDALRDCCGGCARGDRFVSESIHESSLPAISRTLCSLTPMQRAALAGKEGP